MKLRLFSILILASCAHMSVNGPQGRLHTDDGGRGAALPVLFVHGNTGNLTQWRAQLDHLRPARRAVAFDLRGMGMSDPAANGDYSLAAMLDDLDAITATLELNRFVIVGHSYGSAVVGVYAAKHPERVAGVVFVDGGGDVRKFPKEAVEKLFAALRSDKQATLRSWFGPILAPSPESTRRQVYASADETPVEVLIGALHGLETFDVKEALDAYPGPKLAIAVAPIEGPMSLHVQFPEVPVKKMQGVGHWVMLDKPDEFSALLDEFLKQVPSS